MGDAVKKALKWTILTALPVIGLGLYLFFSREKALADAAVRAFSRPVRDVLGTLTGFVPVSVMELTYLAAGAGLIVFIVKLIADSVRGRLKISGFVERLASLALAAAWLFVGYLWLWGIDYRSSSFADRTGFETHALSAGELRSAAEFFTARAMQCADTVQRDENGAFSVDIGTIFDESGSVYDNLERRFPVLEAVSRRPKAMVASRIMSRMGFTGVFFPYTAESNINVDCTRAFIPCTVAHELSHQRGVYSEQEANFLGVTASVISDIPDYVYSGYLTGSVYLMNALYSADKEAWREVYATFKGPFLTDWRLNSEYWSSMQSPVTDASEKIYDTYLRANGQQKGIKSYGACVDMIVAYYESGGYES